MQIADVEKLIAMQENVTNLQKAGDPAFSAAQEELLATMHDIINSSTPAQVDSLLKALLIRATPWPLACIRWM
jgi:hypothetical protein